MNRSDQFTGLFWLAVSILVCANALKDEVGTFHSPGPGFFPFLAGVILGVFAIILIIDSRFNKKRRGNDVSPWKELRWKKVVLLLSCLFLYCALLPIFGYLLSTFGLMTFMLGIMGRSKKWINAVVAFTIISASYLIFYVALEIQLPRGIFGF